MAKRPFWFRGRYLRAIGQITVNLSHLELEIIKSISLLTKEDLNCVLQRFGLEHFTKLIKAFELEFHKNISDKNYKEKFNLIIIHLLSLNRLRNKYVHSLWFFSEDASVVVRLKQLKGSDVDLDLNPKLTQLINLAEEIALSIKELSNFINMVIQSNREEKNN